MAAGSPLPRAGPGSPQPGSPLLPALSAAGFVVLGIGLRPADAARAARSAQQRAVESSKRLRDQPRKNSAVCDVIPRRRRPGGDTSCSTCSRRGEGPVGRAALEGSAAPRRLLLPLAEQGPRAQHERALGLALGLALGPGLELALALALLTRSGAGGARPA